MSQACCQALYKYAPFHLHQNIRTDRIVEAKLKNQRSDQDQLLQELNLSVWSENYFAFLKKFFFFNFFFMFCPHGTAWEILVPRPGIKPVPQALEVQSLTTGPPGKSLPCFVL